MNLRTAIAILGCIGTFTSAVGAQTFRGTIIDDETMAGLGNALVTLLDSRERELRGALSRSDSAGHFVLHAPAPGRYSISVTRIGYGPLRSSPIDFVGGMVVNLNLRMSSLPQKLGTVVVTGTRRLNSYELLSDLGFDLRRSRGVGKFLDSVELREYRRLPLQQLLTSHPGLGVQYLNLDANTRGMNAGSAANARATLNPDSLVMVNGFTPDRRIRTCAPEVWLDGFLAANQMRLATLGADEVYAIEVYSYRELPPASVGAEIGALQAIKRAERAQGIRVRVYDDPECGVIVIWTKAYIAQQSKRTDPGDSSAPQHWR
jgi:hypothetical protein